MIVLFGFSNDVVARNHFSRCHNGSLWGVSLGETAFGLCGPMVRLEGDSSVLDDVIAAVDSDVQHVFVENS